MSSTVIIMKKMLVCLGAVAMIAIMASCQRECTCVTTMNGEVVQTVTMKAAKCADLNMTQTMEGMTQEVKCE